MTVELRRALHDWFQSSARDLPWRGSTDPYGVLVSEVMSQQTRVETAQQYWTRWMAVFPTLHALAAADLDDVMRLWAGLGYYRRARNLHACARIIAARSPAELPATASQLQQLPGIGPYTAAAVASIAFGEAIAAVDGNVTRVVSRLHGIGGKPERAEFRHSIAAAAQALIDPLRPGASNEAAMELGATVCTPRSPSCPECPIRPWCVAHARGAMTEFPPRKVRKPPRNESRRAIVAIHQGAVFLRKRDDDGLLSGLWEFPTYECASAEAALAHAADEHGVAGAAVNVGEIEHIFSHIRMTYHVIFLGVSAPRDSAHGGRWVLASELGGVGLSTAMRRVASRVPELAIG